MVTHFHSRPISSKWKARSIASLFLALLALGRTEPAHAQWIETTGPDASTFIVLENSFFAGRLSDSDYNAALFVSTDKGSTWVADGFDSLWVYDMATLHGRLFIGTLTAGLYVSDDTGRSFSRDSIGLPAKAINAMAVSDSNIIVATDSGAFLSTDGGNSWHPTAITERSQEVTALGANVYANESIDTDGAGETVFYAWYSSDEGRTWQRMGTMVFSYSLVAVDSFIFSASGNGNGVARSSDHGLTWNPVDSGLPLNQNMGYRFNIHNLSTYNGILFLAVNKGVYLSTDLGASWSDVTDSAVENDNAGNPLNVDGTFIWNGYVWAGADDGIWYRPLGQMLPNSAVRESSASELQLNVWPNPVSTLGTIQFTCDAPVSANIEIVDPLGKVRSTIFSGQVAPGPHSFFWNSASVPNGSYELIAHVGSSTKVDPVVVSH